MIRAVIFDIDNTLYSYDLGHAAGWEALCAYAREHLNLDAADLDAGIRRSAELVTARLQTPCAAIHNRILRFQTLLEAQGLPLRHALPMNRVYWDTLMAASQPSPGAMECLAALKAEGYILGIGTDMTIDIQLEKLEKLGMLSYFDFIVSSEEANAEKPDPRLFRICVEKAGVRPEECLFLGDSYKKDYLGPLAAGMQALWYAPEDSSAHPEAKTLTHFAHLPELVKGM